MQDGQHIPPFSHYSFQTGWNSDLECLRGGSDVAVKYPVSCLKVARIFAFKAATTSRYLEREVEQVQPWRRSSKGKRGLVTLWLLVSPLIYITWALKAQQSGSLEYGSTSNPFCRSTILSLPPLAVRAVLFHCIHSTISVSRCTRHDGPSIDPHSNMLKKFVPVKPIY